MHKQLHTTIKKKTDNNNDVNKNDNIIGIYLNYNPFFSFFQLKKVILKNLRKT